MARQKSASKMAYEQNQKTKKSKSNKPLFKNETMNSYENQTSSENRKWSDIYNANSDEMSQYIHSNWKNFYNMIQGQSTDLNNLMKILKTDVFQSLKTVIVSMIDREVDFFKRVEEDYVKYINNNVGDPNRYKNINEVLEKVQEEINKASQTTMIKQMMDININIEKYRSLKKSAVKSAKGKDKEETKKEIDKILRAKLEQKEWSDTLFRAIYDLYTTLENEANQFTQGTKEDLYNNVNNITQAKNLLLAIMQYGRNNNLIIGKNSTEFIKNLKTSGSPEDLLEIMASMNTAELFYELTDDIFINDQGKKTTPQLSKKMGELFETVFPQIMADIGLDSTLSGFEADKKTKKKMKQVGQDFQNFNITDIIFANITTSKGQKINIGASLKLKAEHQTSSWYVITNLWEGKLGSDTNTPDEEKNLINKATKHKNFINWMKNNIITLNSFSADENSKTGDSYNFIQQINFLEQELATLLLLPRFFNGFLKEIKKGEYAAFDATAMKNSPPLSYTIFVIGNNKVYLTSELIKSVRSGLLGSIDTNETSGQTRFRMKMPNGSLKTDIKGWEGDSGVKEAEGLWKSKQEAWGNIEKISYASLMGNSGVSQKLKTINEKLRYRSLSSKVYYDITFDKL